MNNAYSTIFNITSYGAVPDGKTNCTEAFKAAVAECVKHGGGTVYVPAGTFLTGPIHMQSNITLNLDAGAKLVFSDNPEEFPIVVSRWEGEDSKVYSPLIFGDNVQNVAITGRGILEGQGATWWKLNSEKKLSYPRPRFICFQNSNNILIEGITLMNSPAWTINPIMSENITVDKITIKNPANSPNTDGINPESCKNVHISNCHIDVGDDCITLKSGIEDCSVKVPCENITIVNCTMVHGHGGVVIGSEMSGGVKNVTISNCVFEGTDRGIRIKTRRRRGGVVEDIRVSNIVMKNVICPFVMNMYYHCGKNGKEQYVWDKNPYPVDESTPIFRRIHFSNITARGVNAAAGFIYGLPEMPVEDVTFDNVSVSIAENPVKGMPAMLSHVEPMEGKGFFVRNAKNVTFDKVVVTGQIGAAFDIEDSEGVECTRCR